MLSFFYRTSMKNNSFMWIELSCINKFIIIIFYYYYYLLLFLLLLLLLSDNAQCRTGQSYLHILQYV